VHLEHNSLAPPPYASCNAHPGARLSILGEPFPSPKVDFSILDNLRTHAKKKAKQAAKKTQQDKWADSGDEGEKKDDEGADGTGEGGDGAGGVDGGGGGGDDGNGNNGGDDWDEWNNTGGKKNKKKKKGKNAWEDDDEEEERKKKEEEETAAAAEAGVAGNDPWGTNPGGAEANAEDEWGGFTAGKKKKGKKNKVSGSPAEAPTIGH